MRRQVLHRVFAAPLLASRLLARPLLAPRGLAKRIFEPKHIALASLFAALFLLAGCSLLFGGGNSDAPTPEPDNRVLVPTFTPTPELPATEAPLPTEAPAVVEEVATTAPVATEVVDTEVSTPTVAVSAPSPTAIPKAVVNAADANARGGPGTEYALVGQVTQGQAFDVIGKNNEGTWWQFCCVNGQQAWIFGELVNVENSSSVPVAQNIPAAPVAAAPPTAAPAPPAEQPTAAPAPPAEQPTAAPAPPAGGAVNAGACGGDDGCKFHIKGGPTFIGNGGGEMKLQLFFEHSGIDGGQPQGDYRVGVERDGQLITAFADAKSIALNKSNGPSGPYNYEAKLGASNIPGGTLEGRYYIWVLDGNRERDSDVFQLDVPPGQGEIWIDFDQAGH